MCKNTNRKEDCTSLEEYKHDKAVVFARFSYYLSMSALVLVILLTMVSYFISELSVPLQWTTDVSSIFTGNEDHKAHTFLYTFGIQVVLVYLTWLVTTLMDKNRLAKYKIYRLAIPYAIIMGVFIILNVAVFLHTVTQPTIA